MPCRDEKYQGKWKASGRRWIAGTLECSSESGIQLFLNGTFGNASHRQFGGAEVKYSVVHGTTNTGQQLTLLDCAEQSFTTGSRGYPTSTYRADILFVGHHFRDSDHIAFQEFHFDATDLISVTGLAAFEWENKTPTEPRRLALLEPEELHFNMGSFDATIYVTHSVQNTDDGLVISPVCRCMLKAPKRQALKTILRGPVQSLITLIELSMDRPSNATSMYGIRGDTTVEVLYQDARRLPPKKYQTLPGFTLASLLAQSASTLSTWHAFRERCAFAFDLYSFALRAGLPAESRFLTLTQALESLHRGTAKSNRGRFAQRIHRLYDGLPTEMQKLLGDGMAFSQTIANTRNMLTHDDRSIAPALVTSRHLFAGSEQLKCMFMMLTVQALGLPSDQLLQNTVWGNHILSRLQNAQRLLADKA